MSKLNIRKIKPLYVNIMAAGEMNRWFDCEKKDAKYVCKLVVFEVIKNKKKLAEIKYNCQEKYMCTKYTLEEARRKFPEVQKFIKKHKKYFKQGNFVPRIIVDPSFKIAHFNFYLLVPMGENK
jgi:hypothetical protein